LGVIRTTGKTNVREGGVFFLPEEKYLVALEPKWQKATGMAQKCAENDVKTSCYLRNSLPTVKKLDVRT